jgi:hypothetical protein
MKMGSKGEPVDRTTRRTCDKHTDTLIDVVEEHINPSRLPRWLSHYNRVLGVTVAVIHEMDIKNVDEKPRLHNDVVYRLITTLQKMLALYLDERRTKFVCKPLLTTATLSVESSTQTEREWYGVQHKAVEHKKVESVINVFEHDAAVLERVLKTRYVTRSVDDHYCEPSPHD